MPRLTLSRKLFEKTVMTTPAGETIVVQVTMIDRAKVRLEIEAAADVIIQREELLTRPTNYGRRLAGPLPIPTKGRDE